MSNPFFARPILNSPYERPIRHWALDAQGQPTQQIIEQRRPAEFITPIPQPRKRRAASRQSGLDSDAGKGCSGAPQPYAPVAVINQLRCQLEQWRRLPNPSDWHVTPETARLLQHWRHHTASHLRPFFCQVEAVETVIWLTEVAPTVHAGKAFLEHLVNANSDANPELLRLGLKLATGAGKTTVMAMLIAWQTLNAARRPGSRSFTRGFLIVTPGLTIKDRLRVLLPSDPDSYYENRELVPADLLGELHRAKIVITNFHAFKRRERLELSKGGRSLLQGRGEALLTLETDGQMLQRVLPELVGMKNILVLNDEGHHCYRAKPADDAEEGALQGEERKEIERKSEAARLWSSGLEVVQRKLGMSRVIDLSATPFFLRGSGYAEGTLFPWTMSDFSLMDAIESGIVKLPRVPMVAAAGQELALFRNLWESIRHDLPRKGRGSAESLDPLRLPVRLQTALQALYGHYEMTFKLWAEQGIRGPPCFLIVCQNTAISKLIYDYIAGFHRRNEAGSTTLENGRLALFRNFDAATGQPLPRPRTLLIDSEQLEAGDALDERFRSLAADELARFRGELAARTGDPRQADALSDAQLLREVMNTVGKPGALGGGIRCVVAVAMLTEGWDASTVTHILGVRAFGTQLLCEQVIGRALRRQSYELTAEGLFHVEYADIYGIPFDFTAEPVVAPPQPPRETVVVQAMRPERDALTIQFPRVEGYRIELPEERLAATFTAESVLELSPQRVGTSIARDASILGEGIERSLQHLGTLRPASLLFRLTQHLLYTKWCDASAAPKLHLFGPLKRITKQWLETCLVCTGDTHPALLLHRELADLACNKITAGITRSFANERPLMALLSSYSPTGSTAQVRFHTSRSRRWETAGHRCPINWVVLDSDWEAELCRVVESHPRVRAYVKNHNLGLAVPYRCGSQARTYLPDFIVVVDDGRGASEPLHLVLELKGFGGEDAKEKKATMESLWIPAVNHLGTYGRWAFAELPAAAASPADCAARMQAGFEALLRSVTAPLAAKES